MKDNANNKRAYIFGTNDFSKSIWYHVEKQGEVKVAGFLVSQEYIASSPIEFCGLPVSTADKISVFSITDDIGIYIGVGYRKMNAGRKAVYNECKRLGFKILNFIHPTAVVDASKIGEGNIILQGVIIGEYCVIGNCNIFRNGFSLAHDSKIEDNNYFSDQSCINGNVTIGSSNFFGSNCTIKDGITIGNNVLVGANAYVSKDIENDKVIVPARSIILEGKKGIDLL